MSSSSAASIGQTQPPPPEEGGCRVDYSFLGFSLARCFRALWLAGWLGSQLLSVGVDSFH